MMLGAMLRKETLVLLRSRRAVVLLFAYLAVLASVALASWPTDHVLTLAVVASRRMVYLVGIGQLLLLLAIVPGLTAGSVVLERETQSLELLQVSRIRAWQIVVGKWLGSVAFALVLLLCSLPVVTLCQVLGTLDGGLIGRIYLHLALSTVCAAMVGVGASAMARTAYGALMSSYAIVLACSVFPVVPSFLVGGYWPGTLRNMSPIGSMVSLLAPDAWRLLHGPFDAAPSLATYAVFCVAGTVLAGLIAWVQVRRPYQPPQRRGARLVDTRGEILRRKLRFPFYLIDPQRRRRHIGNWINPVFARDVRSRMLGQASNFVRAFYGVLIFSLAVTIYAVLRTEAEIVDSVRVVMIASQVILIGLLAPALTSPAISRERERRTLDLLRLTRMGASTLVLGIWYYALLVSLCILVAALPMWLVVYQMQRIPPEALARAVAVVLSALVCGTTLGLLASSLVRRPGAATGIGYTLTLAVLFGTLVPVVLDETLSASARAWLLSLNPIVAAVHAVSLSLFRNLLDRTAWLNAVAFLLGLTLLSLAGAIGRTWYLFRSR